MQKIILVIGGTGILGQPVCHALKEAGFKVRILTRDRQKATGLFDDSFEITVGRASDTGTIEHSMNGCTGVHISLPNEIERQVAEIVAALAPQQGIDRISYISGATVSQENSWFPMINCKLLAEKAIRESGIPYSIFCPTWVMETLPKFVRKGRATVIGTQPHPYHWVAADDIAAMVAASYAHDDAANKRFLVFGPEAILMLDALRKYCVAIHPEIRNVTMTPFWILKALAALSRNRELRSAVDMMKYFERVGEGVNPKMDSFTLSAPETTLDMWLEAKKPRSS